MPQACHSQAQILQIGNFWNTNFEESTFRGKYQCENFGISVDCVRTGDDVHSSKYFISWILSKGLKKWSDRGNTEQEFFQSFPTMCAQACLKHTCKPYCHCHFNLSQTLGVSRLAMAEAWHWHTLLTSPCNTHHKAPWEDEAADTSCMTKSRGTLMTQHVRQIKLLWLLGRTRIWLIRGS